MAAVQLQNAAEGCWPLRALLALWLFADPGIALLALESADAVRAAATLPLLRSR